MNLDILKRHINTSINNFLFNISVEYNINPDELCGIQEKHKNECTALITRGLNKGKQCSKPSICNTRYCKLHLKKSIQLEENILIKDNKKIKEIKTKKVPTKEDLIDLLNTVVPQEETILKRISKGLIHEETEILFNEEFIVIGRLNKDKIIKLSYNDIERCEKQGWVFDEKAVETDDEKE